MYYITIMFEKITSIKNIENAYLECVENFDLNCKSNRYCGVDNIKLDQTNSHSLEMIYSIQKELESLTPILPVLHKSIPKTNGKKRNIFIYSVKDRIKAQAIYRIIEPNITNSLSPFVFSYRSTHPSHIAAKSIAKRYRKNHGSDYVFHGDVTEYTENIDKTILRNKLKKCEINEKTLLLINLFIDNSIISDEKLFSLRKGIIQGVPLMALFANLYLNDMDLEIGKKVSLYRRVGDDFICFDKNKEKIVSARTTILKHIKKVKLSIQEEKTQIVHNTEKFSFLGYDFINGKVLIRQSSVHKFLTRITKKLHYYTISQQQKEKRIPKIIYEDSDSIHNMYIEFLRSYYQADDYNQIKKISQNCYKSLTKFFFKSYSHKNQNTCRNITKKLSIPSLYNYFTSIHNGKTSFSKLALSKKKSY